ncbi:Coenzyme F420:L-glutamate ligase [archaeon HR06]|nr:Coenzyme F420:L-glutamate ligase [archaeon HR06]
MKEIRIIGIRVEEDIKIGEDLGELILRSLKKQKVNLLNKDILVITQKIVSKAEGNIVDLKSVKASEFAKNLAKLLDKDERIIEIILRESKRIVKMDKGIIICETKHGFICANAGVDQSNVGKDKVSLLPRDPDLSARRIRDRIRELTGKDVAVIISDTFGRPWREGQVNFAIGIAGMDPLLDYRGKLDNYGYELKATVIAVADELASSAELVMGKLNNVPIALIRGYNYRKKEGNIKRLIRKAEKDLFR